MAKNTQKGLTTEEVLKRQSEGKNILTKGKQRSLFSIIFEQFKSPLLLLTAFCGVMINAALSSFRKR